MGGLSEDEIAALAHPAEGFLPFNVVCQQAPAAPSSRGGASSAPRRFVATFDPHPHLWIRRPVSFLISVPDSYPAAAPVVQCLDDDFTKRWGPQAHLNQQGVLCINALQTIQSGAGTGYWTWTFRLIDVVHFIWRSLMREGLLINWLDASGRRSGAPPRTPLLPSRDLVRLESGHFALQGRRNTMEDAAVWDDEARLLHTLPSPTAAPATTNGSPLTAANGSPASPQERLFGRLGIYGIFDGHGGTRASTFVAARLRRLILERLASGECGVAQALYDSFQRVDLEFQGTIITRQGSMDSCGTPRDDGAVLFLAAPSIRPLTSASSGDASADALRMHDPLNGGGVPASASGTEPVNGRGAAGAAASAEGTRSPPGKQQQQPSSPYRPQGVVTAPAHSPTSSHASSTGAAVFLSSGEDADAASASTATQVVARMPNGDDAPPLPVPAWASRVEPGPSAGCSVCPQPDDFLASSARVGSGTVGLQGSWLGTSNGPPAALGQLWGAAGTFGEDPPPLNPSFVVKGASAAAPGKGSSRSVSYGGGASHRDGGGGGGGYGDESGCTAVVAVVTGTPSGGGHVTVASVGDSRAVLCRGGRAIPLSFDHKPSRADEHARIVMAGGMVFNKRVLGRLAVTRAIGDAPLKRGLSGLPIVTSEPELFSTPLCEEDEFLLMGCDGLFDVLSSQEAVAFARTALLEEQQPPAVVAERLARLALEQHSLDNISVIVVIIKPWETVGGAPSGCKESPALLGAVGKPEMGSESGPLGPTHGGGNAQLPVEEPLVAAEPGAIHTHEERAASSCANAAPWGEAAAASGLLASSSSYSSYSDDSVDSSEAPSMLAATPRPLSSRPTSAGAGQLSARRRRLPGLLPGSRPILGESDHGGGDPVLLAVAAPRLPGYEAVFSLDGEGSDGAAVSASGGPPRTQFLSFLHGGGSGGAVAGGASWQDGSRSRGGPLDGAGGGSESSRSGPSSSSGGPTFSSLSSCPDGASSLLGAHATAAPVLRSDRRAIPASAAPFPGVRGATAPARGVGGAGQGREGPGDGGPLFTPSPTTATTSESSDGEPDLPASLLLLHPGAPLQDTAPPPVGGDRRMLLQRTLSHSSISHASSPPPNRIREAAETALRQRAQQQQQQVPPTAQPPVPHLSFRQAPAPRWSSSSSGRISAPALAPQPAHVFSAGGGGTSPKGQGEPEASYDDGVSDAPFGGAGVSSDAGPSKHSEISEAPGAGVSAGSAASVFAPLRADAGGDPPHYAPRIIAEEGGAIPPASNSSSSAPRRPHSAATGGAGGSSSGRLRSPLPPLRLILPPAPGTPSSWAQLPLSSAVAAASSSSRTSREEPYPGGLVSARSHPTAGDGAPLPAPQDRAFAWATTASSSSHYRPVSARASLYSRAGSVDAAAPQFQHVPREVGEPHTPVATATPERTGVLGQQGAQSARPPRQAANPTDPRLGVSGAWGNDNSAGAAPRSLSSDSAGAAPRTWVSGAPNSGTPSGLYRAGSMGLLGGLPLGSTASFSSYAAAFAAAALSDSEGEEEDGDAPGAGGMRRAGRRGNPSSGGGGSDAMGESSMFEESSEAVVVHHPGDLFKASPQSSSAASLRGGGGGSAAGGVSRQSSAAGMASLPPFPERTRTVSSEAQRSAGGVVYRGETPEVQVPPVVANSLMRSSSGGVSVNMSATYGLTALDTGGSAQALAGSPPAPPRGISRVSSSSSIGPGAPGAPMGLRITTPTHRATSSRLPGTSSPLSGTPSLMPSPDGASAPPPIPGPSPRVSFGAPLLQSSPSSASLLLLPLVSGAAGGGSQTPPAHPLYPQHHRMTLPRVPSASAAAFAAPQPPPPANSSPIAGRRQFSDSGGLGSGAAGSPAAPLRPLPPPSSMHQQQQQQPYPPILAPLTLHPAESSAPSTLGSAVSSFWGSPQASDLPYRGVQSARSSSRVRSTSAAAFAALGGGPGASPPGPEHPVIGLPPASVHPPLAPASLTSRAARVSTAPAALLSAAEGLGFGAAAAAGFLAPAPSPISLPTPLGTPTAGSVIFPALQQRAAAAAALSYSSASSISLGPRSASIAGGSLSTFSPPSRVRGAGGRGLLGDASSPLGVHPLPQGPHHPDLQQPHGGALDPPGGVSARALPSSGSFPSLQAAAALEGPGLLPGNRSSINMMAVVPHGALGHAAAEEGLPSPATSGEDDTGYTPLLNAAAPPPSAPRDQLTALALPPTARGAPLDLITSVSTSEGDQGQGLLLPQRASLVSRDSSSGSGGGAAGFGSALQLLEHGNTSGVSSGSGSMRSPGTGGLHRSGGSGASSSGSGNVVLVVRGGGSIAAAAASAVRGPVALRRSVTPPRGASGAGGSAGPAFAPSAPYGFGASAPLSRTMSVSSLPHGAAPPYSRDGDAGAAPNGPTGADAVPSARSGFGTTKGHSLSGGSSAVFRAEPAKGAGGGFSNNTVHLSWQQQAPPDPEAPVHPLPQLPQHHHLISPSRMGDPGTGGSSGNLGSGPPAVPASAGTPAITGRTLSLADYSTFPTARAGRGFSVASSVSSASQGRRDDLAAVAAVLSPRGARHSESDAAAAQHNSYHLHGGGEGPGSGGAPPAPAPPAPATARLPSTPGLRRERVAAESREVGSPEGGSPSSGPPLLLPPPPLSARPSSVGAAHFSRGTSGTGALQFIAPSGGGSGGNAGPAVPGAPALFVRTTSSKAEAVPASPQGADHHAAFNGFPGAPTTGSSGSGRRGGAGSAPGSASATTRAVATASAAVPATPLSTPPARWGSLGSPSLLSSSHMLPPLPQAVPLALGTPQGSLEPSLHHSTSASATAAAEAVASTDNNESTMPPASQHLTDNGMIMPVEAVATQQQQRVPHSPAMATMVHRPPREGQLLVVSGEAPAPGQVVTWGGEPLPLLPQHHTFPLSPARGPGPGRGEATPGGPGVPRGSPSAQFLGARGPGSFFPEPPVPGGVGAEGQMPRSTGTSPASRSGQAPGSLPSPAMSPAAAFSAGKAIPSPSRAATLGSSPVGAGGSGSFTASFHAREGSGGRGGLGSPPPQSQGSGTPFPASYSSSSSANSSPQNQLPYLPLPHLLQGPGHLPQGTVPSAPSHTRETLFVRSAGGGGGSTEHEWQPVNLGSEGAPASWAAAPTTAVQFSPHPRGSRGAGQQPSNSPGIAATPGSRASVAVYPRSSSGGGQLRTVSSSAGFPQLTAVSAVSSSAYSAYSTPREIRDHEDVFAGVAVSGGSSLAGASLDGYSGVVHGGAGAPGPTLGLLQASPSAAPVSGPIGPLDRRSPQPQGGSSSSSGSGAPSPHRFGGTPAPSPARLVPLRTASGSPQEGLVIAAGGGGLGRAPLIPLHVPTGRALPSETPHQQPSSTTAAAAASSPLALSDRRAPMSRSATAAAAGSAGPGLLPRQGTGSSSSHFSPGPQESMLGAPAIGGRMHSTGSPSAAAAASASTRQSRAASASYFAPHPSEFSPEGSSRSHHNSGMDSPSFSVTAAPGRNRPPVLLAERLVSELLLPAFPGMQNGPPASAGSDAEGAQSRALPIRRAVSSPQVLPQSTGSGGTRSPSASGSPSFFPQGRNHGGVSTVPSPGAFGQDAAAAPLPLQSLPQRQLPAISPSLRRTDAFLPSAASPRQQQPR